MAFELVLKGGYMPVSCFTTGNGQYAVQSLQTGEVLSEDAAAGLIIRPAPPMQLLSDMQLTTVVDMRLPKDGPHGVWTAAVYAGRPRGKHILLFAGNHTFAEVPPGADIRQSYDFMLSGHEWIKSVLPHEHLLYKLLHTPDGRPRYSYNNIKALPEFGGGPFCSADCTDVAWHAVVGEKEYGPYLQQPVAGYVADRVRLHFSPNSPHQLNFIEETWEQVASQLDPADVPTPEAIAALIAQPKPARGQVPSSSAGSVGPVRGHLSRPGQQQQQQHAIRYQPYGSKQMYAPARQRQSPGTGHGVPSIHHQAAAAAAAVASMAAGMPAPTPPAVTGAVPGALEQPVAAATLTNHRQSLGLQLGNGGTPSAHAAAANPALVPDAQAVAGSAAAAAAAAAANPATRICSSLLCKQRVSMSCRSLSATTGQWAHDGRLLGLALQEVAGVGGNAEVFKVQLCSHSIVASTSEGAAPPPAAAAAAAAAAEPLPVDAAAASRDAGAATWWAELDSSKAAAATAAAEGAACSYEPPQLFALKVPLPYHCSAPEIRQRLSPAAYYRATYSTLQHEHQLLLRMASCQWVLRSYAYGVVHFGFSSLQRLPCLLLELATGTVEQLLCDHQAAQAAAAAGQPARPVGLPEERVWVIMRNVCHGLVALHKAGIVWKDLKLSNIAVVKRGRRTLNVLCDFGSSVVVGADGLEGTSVPAGTPAFMAPELKYGRRVGLACDVWSMGCLLLALLSGRVVQMLPEDEPSDAAASWDVSAVLAGFKDELRPLQLAFAASCLTYDVGKRPAAHDMLQHEYVLAVPGTDSLVDVPMLNAFDELLGQFMAADAVDRPCDG